MCTRWMMTRFIRWQLRSWLSCILACGVSLDDEPQTERKMRNMAFESIDECRGHKMVNRKSWWRNRSRKNDRQLNSENGTQARNNASVMRSKSSHSSSWSGFNHVQDEEYIVFCFREDGAFDVVKDGTSASLDCYDSSHVGPGPEFFCDEAAETVEECSHDNIAHTSNDQGTIPDEHDEEEKRTSLDTEPPYTSETVRHEADEIANGGIVSVAESSDSKQSFGSTGSFSFPVLQSDFMGSPVQMPKSEGSLQLRKYKVSCARFQCWRF